MLEEKILQDFKDAMKQKDAVKVSILSFLRAQFSYAALEKKKNTLEDAECIGVIKKLIKQHQDSIEQFKAGNRPDLVEKEERELVILKSYLPAELSEAEIQQALDAVIAETGASGMKDMGRVMKELLAKLEGRADAKLASDLVKKALTPRAP